MKAKIASVFLLFIICCFSSCTIPEAAEKSDFFFWMDGYVASPLNEEYTLALTYYYQNIDYLQKDSIASFSLQNCDAITVDSFTQENMDFGSNAKYHGHSFHLKLKYHQTGLFVVDKIIINFNNGTSISYPIGIWHFDIGEPENQTVPIDTWGGVTSTGDPSEFAYDYTKNDSKCFLIELKYGNGLSLHSTDGVPLQGKIKLSGDAPVKFIKTKLTIINNGNYEVVYGHGCYCGSLNINEQDVQMSKEHSQKYFSQT